ncbi:DUF397 domain-containing protein [Streptomyces sp. NPDC001719]
MIRHYLSRYRWRKSSYSPDESDDCVEIRLASGELIAIRDSKARSHGALTFPPQTWQTFVHAIQQDVLNPAQGNDS